MKILVTGGAGFIGSYLVEALISADYDVTVVDNFSSGLKENLVTAQKLAATQGKRLEVLDRNICDTDFWGSLGRYDGVYHFAAQSSVSSSVDNVANDFESNVQPWGAIIKWIRKTMPKLFVYASSAGSAYGEAMYHPTDERVLLKPLSPYGATKAFGDIYLAAVVHSLKQAGEMSSDPKSEKYFTWASLRFSNVYGPRQRPLNRNSVVPIFLSKMLAGQAPTIYGDGNKIRDYLYIQDAVSMATVLLKKSSKAVVDEIFNVSLGEEIKDLRVFDSIMDAVEEYCRENSLDEMKKKISGIREPIFIAVRPGEVMHSSVSSEKAKAIMGWRPETSFDKGIRDTVRSYLAEHFAGDAS